MEATMTKVILVFFTLVVVAILLVAYVRIHADYQEVQALVSGVHDRSEMRTLTTMYCFLNRTSGNVEIHVFNYGSEDLSYRLAVFYQMTDGTKVKLVDSEEDFPSGEMKIVEVSLPETPPSSFDMILIWPEAGEIESVGCVGS